MRGAEIRTTEGAELELPAELSALRELAYSLWWTWSHRANRLFHRIDPMHWMLYRNPVELLINVRPERWEELRGDPEFNAAYTAVVEDHRRYLDGGEHSWLRRAHPEYSGGPVAYFSSEFGWHECLPGYSGGLGVLAGDHSKAAGDLGLPFVGVGLAYHRGYFRQTIDFEGNQQHFYREIDLSRLPLRPVVGRDGRELEVGVEFPGREVHVRVWKADVGRVPVLLLDSNIDRNHPADRRITSILYVQGREMRLCQEILLGIGGARVLDALGITPAVWHINEGHSSLLLLQRIKDVVEREGVGFEEARRSVARNVLFTTHTPVPAGNESFHVDLVLKYLRGWADGLGIGEQELLALGRPSEDHDLDQFNLTALALRTSRGANGVSELHGRVATKMWSHLDLPDNEQTPPIQHVTNGVHISTWLGWEMQELLEKHLGRGFKLNLLDPGFADAVQRIPDDELWEARRAQKDTLVEFVRSSVLDQFARYGRSPDDLRGLESLLDPEALTLGFARRFATYKRASLIFRDPGRLHDILTGENRPVQILFAGKAHPADRPGQDLIRAISGISHSEQFLGRVLFLENYNMRLARCLVQGVDLWLNTPRRPLEASGTSGMKAALNGGLNISVLDGWWCEGYDPAHGWAIGPESDREKPDEDDRMDAESLYSVLAEDTVPSFYERDESGLPRKWIARIKASMGSLIPRFSASRMVREYTERFYLPSSRR